MRPPVTTMEEGTMQENICVLTLLESSFCRIMSTITHSNIQDITCLCCDQTMRRYASEGQIKFSIHLLNYREFKIHALLNPGVCKLLYTHRESDPKYI